MQKNKNAHKQKSEATMIQSHIQVPKGILKNFCDPEDSGKRVWWLDLKSQKIKKHSPRILGTESGYFSAKMENTLDEYAENDIAVFGQQIKAFFEDPEIESTIVSEKDVSCVIRYIKMLVSRSQLVYESYLQSTPLTLCFSTQMNHDLCTGSAIASQSKWDEILGERRFSLLLNCTDYHLVLPRNGFYFFECTGGDALLAPISPKGGLLLLPKEFPVADPSYIMYIRDPTQVRQLNLRALKYEHLFHGAFVASDCQEPLIYLQEFLKEHEHDMSTFWSFWKNYTDI